MGAVGSTITAQVTQSVVISSTSPKSNRAQKITDYFKQRTLGKLDITPYLEPAYDKRGYTTIDYTRMPKLVQQLYNQVVQEGRIESADYGAWGKWIKLKR